MTDEKRLFLTLGDLNKASDHVDRVRTLNIQITSIELGEYLKVAFGGRYQDDDGALMDRVRETVLDVLRARRAAYLETLDKLGLDVSTID